MTVTFFPRGETSISRRPKLLPFTFFVLLCIAPFTGYSATEPGGNDLRVSVGPGEPGVGEIRILPGAASAAGEQELRIADHDLIEALAKHSAEPLALLDSEFTWIDRDGRSRRKSDVGDHLILLAAGPDEDVAVKRYGRVALVTGMHRLAPDNAEAFFARVWIRQAGGWRLLIYQETSPADFPGASRLAPGSGVSVRNAGYGVGAGRWGAPCENPCRTLPYKPLSPDAQEIVGSFMAGEKAVFEADEETAGRILSDDVRFVMPDRAQPIEKTERIAAMKNLAHAPQAPPAVVSMSLRVYGNAAVMAADEESSAGEPLRATRIWTRRDGQWQLAFSQQTLVQ